MAEKIGGLLTVKSGAELDREERAAREKTRAAQEQPVVKGLAHYVERCWQAARQAKEQELEPRMLKCLMARKGEYDESTKAAIVKEHGELGLVYMMLTDEKCTAFETLLEEVLFESGESPWGFKPTPVPDLQPEQIESIDAQVKRETMTKLKRQLAMEIEQGLVGDQAHAAERLQELMEERVKEIALESIREMQEAAKRELEHIKLEVDDKLVEAGWIQALKEAVPNIVGYPVGYVKGPIVRRRKQLVWGDQGVAAVVEKPVVEFTAPSPWDIYHAPGAKGRRDGYIIEKHRLPISELRAMKGTPGYSDAAIDAVVQEFYNGGLTNWLWLANEKTRARLEGRPREEDDPQARIDALEYTGEVHGYLLLDWGMDPKRVPDPMAVYMSKVWLVGQYVIKATLHSDPLGRREYYWTSLRKVPGSIVGKGLPEVIADSQEQCNAAARNIVRNMSIGSGPMVGVDKGGMAHGEDETDIRPWKVWSFDLQNQTSSRPPIWFFAPPMVVGELLKVYEFFSSEADTKAMLPRFTYGPTGGSKGALGTASGMAIMQGNANRGVKKVIRHMDDDIHGPSAQRMYEWLMLYDRTVNYRGDIKLVATGSSALVEKEQNQVRRQELMQLMLNQVVLEIIGKPGFAEFLRPVLEGAGLDPDIVPTREEMLYQEMQRMLQQAQMVQQPQGPGAQPGNPHHIPRRPELDAAGNVAGGRDANLFQGRRQQ